MSNPSVSNHNLIGITSSVIIILTVSPNSSYVASGMGDRTLAPQGVATRAQVAQILMQFCEKVL